MPLTKANHYVFHGSDMFLKFRAIVIITTRRGSVENDGRPPLRSQASQSIAPNVRSRTLMRQAAKGNGRALA